MARGGISRVHLSQNSALASWSADCTNRSGKISLENPPSALVNSNQAQSEEIQHAVKCSFRHFFYQLWDKVLLLLIFLLNVC